MIPARAIRLRHHRMMVGVPPLAAAHAATHARLRALGRLLGLRGGARGERGPEEREGLR